MTIPEAMGTQLANNEKLWLNNDDTHRGFLIVVPGRDHKLGVAEELENTSLWKH